MQFEKLQQRLHYHFGDRGLLIQALTHRSYGHEKLQDKSVAHRDNERLEFLGDAVLDLVISDLLLEYYSNSSEGRLSKMRAAIVNEKTLAEVARKINLEECIRLGNGELQNNGQQKPSILSSAFEAIIAAVYLDGGFNAVYPVVRALFSSFFEEDQDLVVFYDHKTQLQEIMQARWKVTPQYKITKTEGPDHAKTFEIEVKAKGKILANGLGPSKKQAEQNAAKLAIENLSEQLSF